ncbi:MULTISPECIES: pyocin knob domain-containing protein [unclassified Simplicispira]|uniref:pyocin knob domain-containing protein n=1 Tax=unclassified Simplicispira TaxID=2630407 RepID=UPI000D5F1F06|nr:MULTISPECIES: pyocin knob domain-containing protein [unclassified Simplicispira]PVY56737.1 hypothetical protein C8D04_2001 [Simplicispira sp. 125]REG17681.1 hypothetical protein C8D01_2311 [Simplicispira sp. 110]
MTVETASYISQLSSTSPASGDPKSEGDDQIRLIKTVLKTQFPNFGTAAMTATTTELNYSVGVTSAIQAQLNTLTNDKAAKAGDTYTGAHDFTGGTIAVPMQTTGDATANAASTAFVAAAAFASALPSQTGNNGKFVTTDGSNASWAAAVSPAVSLGDVDLNTATTSGFYYFGTPTNGPAGVTASSVYVSRSGDVAAQIVVQASAGLMFSRGVTGLNTSPVWSNWKRVAMHSDKVTALAGGDMDCSVGNYFTETVAGTRTFAFTNIPAGAYNCVLEINHTSGAITMPAGTVWAGATPTFTTGKRHLVFFQRAQAGTAGWFASALIGYSA